MSLREFRSWSKIMQSQPRNHHYIPELYLKNFSVPKGKTNQVWVKDKVTERIYISSVSNICAERDFYRISGAKDEFAWEREYANEIEPELKADLSYCILKCDCPLLVDGAEIIDKTMQKKFAKQLAYQILRGVTTREKMNHLFSKEFAGVAGKLIPLLKEAKRDDLLELIDSEETKNKVRQESIYEASIAPDIPTQSRFKVYEDALLNKTWMFCRNDTDIEFGTSDNPIMVYNYVDRTHKPFQNGIALKTSIISYPISSSLLLLMLPPVLFFTDISRYNRRVITLCESDVIFIKEQNKMQYDQAYRIFIAKNKKTLDLISSDGLLKTDEIELLRNKLRTK